MAERKVTPEQCTILDEADAALSKLLDESAKKHAAARFRSDEPGTFCFRCPCPNYIPRDVNHGGLGLPRGARGTPGCGHMMTSHNVF